MVFFDLNIPYVEAGEIPLPEKSSKKSARLKIVVKAMELGYTGIAYNRSFKGVMSDSDRCTISLFPLSSLLKLAPTLCTSVKFHRDLLGIPSNSPFRQYTRLTVSVASSAQAAALNSGNPVLKTYDLVAVRPLNQSTFEQACQVSEVDLIAIDFSEKLPFRLKLPIIKAAIGRGVYFEITYSPLISDVHTRRQLISNAKLLVDWTRGKNLIFSSSAPSVSELRGPYDVANLLTLLGLSMERAKAAISKNCRSLMAKALRKKQYHKEAIRVEIIPSGEPVNSKEPWFIDLNSWDPISSGEGDLLLDDIAKFFSASSKVSKTSKAIDFDSIAEGMETNSRLLKDSLSGTGVELKTSDDATNIVFAVKEIEESGATNEVFKQSEVLNIVQNADLTSQASGCEDAMESSSPNDTPTPFTEGKGIEAPKTCTDEPQSSDMLDVIPVAVETLTDMRLQGCKSSCETKNVLTCLTSMNDIEPSAASNAYSKGLNAFDAVPLQKDYLSSVEGDLVSPSFALKLSTPIEDIDLLSSCNKHEIMIDDVLTKTEEWKRTSLAFASCDVSLHENAAKKEILREHEDGADVMLLEDYSGDMQDTGALVADNETQADVSVDIIEQKQADSSVKTTHQTLEESKSGKCRSKQRRLRHPFMFSFKHFLKPVLFKRKKSWKSRNTMNLVHVRKKAAW